MKVEAVKVWIWFWSFLSGMCLFLSVASYKMGYIWGALIGVVLLSVTSLIAFGLISHETC